MRNLSRTLPGAVIGAVALAVLAGGLLVVATAAPAAEAQTGPRPPETAKNLEIVAYHDLGQTPGDTSDVWYLNDTAYVGYRCGPAVGSSVVDVSDRTQPQVLFQTDSDPHWFANDVKALSIDTDAFTGDLMLEPHDGPCNVPDDPSDLPPAFTRIWDVSDPASPELLSTFIHGDGVHNAYAYQRGEKAYMILAAPGADRRDNSDYGFEDQDLDADFAIVDITDPAAPTLLSTWNARDTYGQRPGSVFQHDVWANADGTIAYGAYWDLGMVLLDISDPSNPTPIAEPWGYADTAEGNTHAIVPLESNEDLLVVADEDYDPTDSFFEVLEPDELAGEKDANTGAHSRVLGADGTIEGELVWVGRGCDADPNYGHDQPDPYLNDATDKIAVIVRGDCTFAGKIRQAQENGAKGAVIVNHTPGQGPPPMGGGPRQDTTIPGVGISYEDGNAITTTLEAGTTVTAKWGMAPGEWGYTRFVDVSDPDNPVQVSEYVLPETRAFPPVTDGTYSAHNPWTVGDMVYLSHYSAGVRMVDLADPANPVEHGYITFSDKQVGDDTVGSSIWGVITDEQGYIYASDIGQGLWILCETGNCPDAPSQPTTEPPTATPPPTSLPPPETPTPQPTAQPTDGPQDNVCPHILNRVPQAAINSAVANPQSVRGYNQLRDPGKPQDPHNQRRLWLSMTDIGKPYHPLFNSLEYKVGCP